MPHLNFVPILLELANILDFFQIILSVYFSIRSANRIKEYPIHYSKIFNTRATLPTHLFCVHVKVPAQRQLLQHQSCSIPGYVPELQQRTFNMQSQLLHPPRRVCTCDHGSELSRVQDQSSSHKCRLPGATFRAPRTRAQATTPLGEGRKI